MKKIIFLFLVINCSLIIANAQTGWYIQNSPLNYAAAVFFLNDDTGWAAQWNGGVIKTTNQGMNWILLTDILNFPVTDLYFINEFTGWMVGSSAIIRKTTNSGVNWFYVSCSQCTTADDFLQVQMVDENTGYAFGDQRIVKTTNGGIDWIPLEIYLFSVYRGYFFNADTGFISGLGAFAKTTNGGINWIQNHFTNNWTSSVYFRNINTGWITSRSGEIFKTINGGNNWAIQYYDTAKIFSNIIFTSIDTGWAIGFKTNPQNQGFVLKTTNSGQTWGQQQTPVSYFEDIFMINSMNGWIAGAEIMHTTNGGGTVNVFQYSTEIPDRYMLFQNYPNPFNPTTKIKFDIPGNLKFQISNLKLLVYDILGKEIQTLVREHLQPGSYEVTFDGSNLPSGVYFYRLRINEFVDVKKMILMK